MNFLKVYKPQPTVSDIQSVMVKLEKVASNTTTITEWLEDHVRYRNNKRNKYWNIICYPCSDITDKCYDCNKPRVSRRDSPGNWMLKNATREEIRNPHAEWVKVCLSCHNKRRPIQRALKEYNNIRLDINRIKRELNK